LLEELFIKVLALSRFVDDLKDTGVSFNAGVFDDLTAT
jgi:hypothetical protein